jgi:PPOX class probable F420-dependent enzyme
VRRNVMRKMDATEVMAYIDEKPRTAHLATVRADGRPHVATIWVVRDGDDIVFTTWHTSVKGKNLARTGQAALSLDDQADSSYVAIEGTVTIDEDPAVVRIWATRLGGKYMGEDRAEEFGKRNGVPGEVTCRLRPTHLSGARGVTD